MAPKRSDIWLHFECIKDKCLAECLYCKRVLSTKNGSMGNLHRHMKQKHPTINISTREITEVAAKLQKLSRENSIETPDTSSSGTIFTAIWDYPFSDEPSRSSLNELKPPKPSKLTSKDTFNATIDVRQFNPDELMVKVTEDKMIIIEGRHEDKQDEIGYICRHFIRKIFLPERFDVDRIQTTLSTDGVLNITAPKRLDITEGLFKELPITLIGPVK